jgi:hypothetical protein
VVFHKFPDWPPGARTANDTLPATRCSCIAILWVSLVSFAAITLCVASKQVFIDAVVYFVIDSVRKLLDIPSYAWKVKVKLYLCFDWASHHKGVLGSGGIAPLIFYLGTRWRWVVSFTPRQLYSQGKSPWYPLYRRLDGLPSRSGRGGEEKNSQPLPELELQIIQPVAHTYTTELFRLVCVWRDWGNLRKPSAKIADTRVEWQAGKLATARWRVVVAACQTQGRTKVTNTWWLVCVLVLLPWIILSLHNTRLSLHEMW